MSKEEIPKKVTAEDLAKKQREISVSEFFLKNRHLLGFDNPLRALLMTIKEAVDNSADACDEIRILPEVIVEIKQLNEERFIVSVEDNGPGIVKQQIPNIFGKLLYGSKFHSLRQNRGSQGLGVSASVLYGQLTTGKPAKILSKTDTKKPAHYFELTIDTKNNKPEILKEEQIEWNKDHGTKIEIELTGKYQKGKQSVDEYLKQTAIVNPHLHLIYISPLNERIEFPRATNQLPPEAKEIKPHPHGIELGTLIKMLQDTNANTLSGFLQNDFCRIGPMTAKEICHLIGLSERTNPSNIISQDAEKLFTAIQSAKVIAPPIDCLSPIGQDLLEKGLRKEINAEFYVATTRPPSVYRGFPFVVECAIAYGGELEKEGSARLLRFANRVPLIYQQGACAITEAVAETNWKPYGLQQSANSLPAGPLVIAVHIASVWVPFTSEAKEALAHYPEIIKEIKLVLQECGRKLAIYIHKNVRAKEQKEKMGLFEKYIPELANSLSVLSNEKKEDIIIDLQKILKRTLPKLEEENTNE